MKTKVRQIDDALSRIQTHLRSGQCAEALQVFNTEIYRQLELFEEAAIRKLRERSEALVASNDRLRSVDASRANFFADISHELRTPLTILRGQAEMATRAVDVDAGVMRHALGDIVRKADQMGRLIDDLLFPVRSESGSIMANRTRIVLQDIVRDVLLDGQNMAMRPGVRIRPSQPGEPVEVLGDPDRLRQAVLMALDNAIRLAPAVTTASLELAQPKGQAHIRIRDQGPGFTGDELGSALPGSAARARQGRDRGLGWDYPSRNGSWTSMTALSASTVLLPATTRPRAS